jgi:predicted PhzF superfamily epimerase YddE/YHI9
MSSQRVGGLRLDQGKLAPEHVVTVICQRPSGDSTADFHYRVFAMPTGIMEDPVCGSAASFSAKYWAGRIAASRNESGAETPGSSTTPHNGDEIAMKIRAVGRRGGYVELVWEESSQTAKIGGNARVASRGEIYI